jgi:uncharacterized protein
MSASALYEGTIRHRRHAVRATEFTHRLTLAYVDLDELPGLLGGMLVRRRPGLVRFRRSDYLGDPGVPLGDAVRALVAQRTGAAPDGPVGVLTGLRSFGHCFNPVSFYYCHDAGGRLAALVAEVTNTPWGERHAYVLPVPVSVPGPAPVLGDVPVGDPPAVFHARAAKQLHVSPFMPLDQVYEIRATPPGPTLSVHIDSRQDGASAFDATLSLRRRPLTRATLARATARHPAATLRVLTLIYRHALGLWLRGVPPHPHRRAA